MTASGSEWRSQPATALPCERVAPTPPSSCGITREGVRGHSFRAFQVADFVPLIAKAIESPVTRPV